MADHYAILGVPRTASTPDIQLAYRRRAREAHPDIGGSNGEMTKLNLARETLTDPAARETYDRVLAAPTRSAPRPRSTSTGRASIHVEMPATMPWGKYRDQLLEDIPSDYFRWVVREATYADKDLRRDIEAELARRRSKPGRVEYVRRGMVVHLSIDGDLPLCGSFYSWRGSEHRSTHWLDGKACQRGCFK
jgi:curved DNA-binding protein CbpA